MVKLQSMNKHWVLSILLFLLLVLFFVKPRIFSQLFKSILGRGFLVLLIIFITYCHQVWGLIFVLFLIVLNSGIFNNETNGYPIINDDYQGYYNEFDYNYSFIEGLKNHSNGKHPKKHLKKYPKKNNKTNMTKTTPLAPSTSTTTTSPMIKTTSKSLEGFDLLGLEDNMKRGKQSSTIPMGQSRNSSDSVMPYEESMFYSRP